MNCIEQSKIIKLRKIVLGCICLLVAFFTLLIIPATQNLFLAIIEKVILNRELRKPEKWITLMRNSALLFFYVISFFIILFALRKNNKIRDILSFQNLFFFLILFVFLIYRTPEDFFTPYLWAEDGTVLIQGSIFNGLKGVFLPGNGTYWVIQKILSLHCYWAVLPFENIEYLPYIQQTLSKIIATLCVMYFMSDRFEWLVQNKTHRFLICIAIILLMPQHSYDVLTCETSLFVELFFVAFLIGLDLLCNPEVKSLSVLQTIFLALLAVSHAGAPFIAAVAGLGELRWLISKIKNKTLTPKNFIPEFVKVFIILIFVFIQLKLVLSSGRVNTSIDLWNRLAENTKSFMFFPYWHKYHSWKAFVIGLLLWIVILCCVKISWKVVIYSGIFSYLFMFYCSMTTTVENAYLGSMTARYVFNNFEIVALMLGVVVVQLLFSNIKQKKYLAYTIIVLMSIVSLRTYNVTTQGSEFATSYSLASGLFKKNGKDFVKIPLAPWMPWEFMIPADIQRYTMCNDLVFFFESLDGISVGEGFGNIRANNFFGCNITGWAKATIENKFFKRLLLKVDDNTYKAAKVISLREYFYDKKLYFEFDINSQDLINFINNGVTTFELIGETVDGELHYGTINIETKLIY